MADNSFCNVAIALPAIDALNENGSQKIKSLNCHPSHHLEVLCH